MCKNVNKIVKIWPKYRKIKLFNMFRPYMAIFRHFSCKDPHAPRTNRIFVLCSSSYHILVCGHQYFTDVSFSCVRLLGVPCVPWIYNVFGRHVKCWRLRSSTDIWGPEDRSETCPSPNRGEDRRRVSGFFIQAYSMDRTCCNTIYYIPVSASLLHRLENLLHKLVLEERQGHVYWT
jgi:hypothetical protein